VSDEPRLPFVRRRFASAAVKDDAGPAEFSGWGWLEKAGQITETIPLNTKRKYGRSMN
jgi:hypothetical protein